MYKELYNILPIEIINYIADYNNNSKENMNNVIIELQEYNDKVHEYERAQYCEWLGGDRYELNTNIKKSWEMESPYLLSNKWRF